MLESWSDEVAHSQSLQEVSAETNMVCFRPLQTLSLLLPSMVSAEVLSLLSAAFEDPRSDPTALLLAPPTLPSNFRRDKDSLTAIPRQMHRISSDHRSSAALGLVRTRVGDYLGRP